MLSPGNTPGAQKTVIVFMPEEKKISEIYQAFSNELFSYLVRLTSNRENAEDLLHDTFATLITYSKNHPIEEVTVRAFLYKTAHNLAVNFIKKQSRSTLSDKLESLPAAGSVEEENSAQLLQAEIYSILDTLDAVDRSIFIMKKELSMSTKEIAQTIKKSERTIRRSLEKTLKILALELKKTGFLSRSLISVTVFSLSIVLLKGDNTGQ